MLKFRVEVVPSVMLYETLDTERTALLFQGCVLAAGTKPWGKAASAN